ncbi:TPA: hypothetical protein ACXYLJ_002941 [Legionella pneumophila]
MDNLVAFRAIVICIVFLLPITYYIFSTSIKRACLLFSITISMYLSLEALYFSNYLWLSAYKFIGVLVIIIGSILIQFCRIHLIKYIFKRGEQFLI